MHTHTLRFIDRLPPEGVQSLTLNRSIETANSSSRRVGCYVTKIILRYLVSTGMPILRSRYDNKRITLPSLAQISSLVSFGILISAFLIIVPASAEEECLHSRLWCYECDSWSDHRCKDPFNETLSLQEPILLQKCHGCCVKIVTKKGTPQETIKRTCTTSLQINLFLVDHVCMKESEGKGTMCFCESESCNVGSILSAWDRNWTPLWILLLCFLYSRL